MSEEPAPRAGPASPVSPVSPVSIVTGASGGIGAETAVQLAQAGHHVVVVGRSPERTRATLARVRAASPDHSGDCETADFASLEQVRALAARLRSTYPRIEVLVNNAGGVWSRRTLTEDGYESTFAVNHLAPFLLTELLRDRLLHSAPARVVLTASTGHYQGTMDLDDPGYARGGYRIMRAYSRSKLANVLYTRRLARDLAGTGVTATCLHPGAVATGIWDGAPALARPVLRVAKRWMVTPEEGGRHITYLASSAEVAGASGGYYEDDQLREPAALAQDDALADALYDLSQRLVGLA